MKRKWNAKRILCLGLAGVMLLGTMTGCGKTDNDDSKGKGKTLTVGIPQHSVVSEYDENAFTKYVEENLDINLEFVLFSSGEEATKQLTLMCAGGEVLPDVLVGFSNIGYRMVRQFGEDGFFLDVKELIEEKAPTFNKQMESLPKEAQDRIWRSMTSIVDGSVYGFPTYSAPEISDYMQNMMYINQSWLDAVGMQKPTTIDELHDVLVAFRDEDPNGNEDNDEIPMFRSGIWNYVINAFVYYDEAHPLNVTDGKVWDPTITDEFRQALIYLNGLYKENLLTDQSFGKNTTDMKTLISGDGDVATVGIWWGQPMTDIGSYSQVLNQYTVLEPLQDATGKGGFLVRRPNDLLLSGFITRDCKDTDLAMRFLDFLYEDESVTRRRHGELGVHWEYSETAEKSIFNTDSKIKIISEEDQSESVWGVHLPNIYTNENYLAIAESTTSNSADITRLLRAQTELMTSWRKPEEYARDLSFTAEEDEKLESLNAAITSYTTENISLFIVGDKDASDDSVWNNYVKTLEGYGTSERIKITQQAYDRMTK